MKIIIRIIAPIHSSRGAEGFSFFAISGFRGSCDINATVAPASRGGRSFTSLYIFRDLRAGSEEGRLPPAISAMHTIIDCFLPRLLGRKLEAFYFMVCDAHARTVDAREAMDVDAEVTGDKMLDEEETARRRRDNIRERYVVVDAAHSDPIFALRSVATR